ncbi:MAG: hypothetical protein K2X99_09165, partial [Gemmatimonadaceae bacterium]|nr:hypothetical protein [Gemmatimonadaceae bacterium]
MIPSTVLRTALLVALPATLTAQSLPMKRVATPTTAAINATDLMSRLYAYADDSMGGRGGGTIYNTKATDFIAAELKRLGLKPGGTDGYFQSIPLVRRGPDASSTLSVDGQTFALNTDFLLA